jgi:hypothetical protein
MPCPGSIRLSREVPDAGASNTSVYAQEGTRAHAVGQLSLEKEVDPDFFVGMELEGGKVPDDMADHVRTYVDYCRGYIFAAEADPQCRYWIEKPFNLGALNPPGPMFGTADFVFYDFDTRMLHVVDLKYGQGVVVEAIGNKQLRYYALGAALSLGPDFPIDLVRMTIVQPRVSHPDGIIRTDTIAFIELVGFANELLDAARETTKPDAPLHAGDHCRFCPASGICPEQRKRALEIAQSDFEVLPTEFTPPSPSTIPKEQFVEMLGKLHVLEDWASAMRAYAQGMLERGEDVPGFKMVAKRATRKWADEDAAIAALFAQGYTEEEICTSPELRSPAAIEQLLKKKPFAEQMSQFVEKKSSGYTMVADSDSRPAVALSPGDDFLALPSGE